jgi:acyl-CoA thioester hydrolase
MTNSSPAELAEFAVVVPWPVQWGDQDAFGHVNNTVYFRWVETARIAYLEKIDLRETTPTQPLGPILAAVSCNYRRQVRFPDTIRIGVRVSRVGRSSCGMEHILWSERQQAVVADGQATIVMFDYSKNASCPIPQDIRAAIAALEQRPIEGV